jgi:hypothetical protein
MTTLERSGNFLPPRKNELDRTYRIERRMCYPTDDCRWTLRSMSGFIYSLLTDNPYIGQDFEPNSSEAASDVYDVLA